MSRTWEPREIALLAASAVASKKGIDPLVLDVADTLVITSYFVIASGSSDRQVAAIADAVEDTLREQAGIKPIGREGERERKWILLDFTDVVVHIFQPEEREFYRLEKLWSDAPRLEIPHDEPAPAAGS
ncbi:MAG: ribosome silencing factor [Actinomycetota bacterium]